MSPPLILSPFHSLNSCLLSSLDHRIPFEGAHRKAMVTFSYFLFLSVCQRVDLLFHARHLFEANAKRQTPNAKRKIQLLQQGEAIANKK
jgi:hypothetical protein